MIDEESLKYFITEEVFLINEDEQTKKDSEAKEKSGHPVLVWTHELTDKDQDLLEKMLQAVNLDLSKVHLIHQEQDYVEDYKILLSFGHANFVTEKIKREVFLNQPIETEENNILVSYPISSLHTDVKKKAELWQGMKKLFKI